VLVWSCVLGGLAALGPFFVAGALAGAIGSVTWWRAASYFDLKNSASS
jgi:hypothetical protein